MKYKALYFSVKVFALVLFCYGTVCFGQKATLDSATCLIVFRIGSPKLNQIIDVDLKNPTAGVTQKYTVNNPDANLRLRAAGVNGLLAETIRFNIKSLAGGSPCNMNVNGVANSLPANLVDTPLILIVEYQPDPAEPNKRDYAIIKVTATSQTLQEVKLPIAAAEERDDAEFYLAGESITAVGEGPKFSADIKVEREFGASNVPFLYTPFFELKWSNTKADSDNLGIGIKFSNSFKFAEADNGVTEDFAISNVLQEATTRNTAEKQTPKFTQIKKRRTQAEYFLWEGTAQIESTFNFRVTNFITSQELKYKLRPTIFRNADGDPLGKGNLTPFIGTELGRNLKSPVERDERGIVRLKAGASLNLNINKPFGHSFVQAINWENSFVQRWFVIKEQAYDKDDDGNLILRDFGRRPRSYFSSDLQFKLSDYVGFGMKYEWGQLPPLYEKVNYRLKVGFTYSFRRKAFQ
jgi:hypothetical protein